MGAAVSLRGKYPLKVTFAIKGLHEAAGGAERVISAVSSELAERGHNIELISFDAPDAEPFYPVSPKVTQIRLGIGHPHQPTTAQAFLRRCIVLRRVVSNSEPDVVVGFMHSMFIPMGFALLGTGIPVIASEHIVREHYRQRFGELALFVSVMPALRKVTILSRDIADEYPWLIRRKMICIDNPVSTDFESAQPHASSPDSKEILSIGRLVAQKDHATLIRAFSLVAADFPDWSLRIIGDGDMRQSLAHLIQALALEGRVFLPGIVRDVGRHIERCEFFALASRYESFGLVVAEAMAMGKAAVGFGDCHGVNRLIQHNHTGLLVKGEDRIASLAAALRWLMANPADREKMGFNAWRRAKERFSLRRVVDQWEGLLKEILED